MQRVWDTTRLELWCRGEPVLLRRRDGLWRGVNAVSYSHLRERARRPMLTGWALFFCP